MTRTRNTLAAITLFVMAGLMTGCTTATPPSDADATSCEDATSVLAMALADCDLSGSLGITGTTKDDSAIGVGGSGGILPGPAPAKGWSCTAALCGSTGGGIGGNTSPTSDPGPAGAGGTGGHHTGPAAARDSCTALCGQTGGHLGGRTGTGSGGNLPSH